MNLYKKNPVIKGDICVNGEMLDDNRVVAGAEFDVFSDGASSPDGVPRLVRVNPDVAGIEAVKEAQELVQKKASEPPRHLGVITSAAFSAANDGSVVINVAREEQIIKEEVKEEVKKEVKEEVKEEVKKEVKEEVDLVSNYDELSLRALPGVTDGNSNKVLKIFPSLKTLSMASNADLKRAGVNSNFYKRLRAAVLAELKKD